MTLTYPAFWRGFRWDVERLVRDVFMFEENPSAAGLDGLDVVPWFPEVKVRDAWLSEGNAYLWVHRLDGHLNRATMAGTDESVVQLAGLGRSRDDTMELMEYVAMVLSHFDEGGLVHRAEPHLSGATTTFMKVPANGELVGPQLIPERFRDDRLIPAQWEIHADLPQGLPDYRELLGLD